MRKEIDGLATLIQDSNSIHTVRQSSCFAVEGKSVINVYTLMEMASLCFINDWIMANSNGHEMKMKFVGSRNNNFVGYLKDSQFINRKPYKNLKKVSFNH